MSADLRERIEGLEERETMTAEELEDLRRSLPTDPLTARAVKLALPYPWSEVFEYVEGSERQSAYWRTKPDRSSRSEAQRRRDELAREAGEVMTGIQGTVEQEGREIPASAAVFGQVMEGRRFLGRRVARSGRRALRRLRSLLEV